jgi:uncharacterized OsmC-like protein
MKSVSVWVDGMRSIVDNGRNHSVVIDLPNDQGGGDLGATALELAVMALSGCISTVFAIIAKKSRFEFEKLKVDVNAEKGSKTIESAEIKVYIKAEDKERAARILEKTISTCPVGVLFEKASVKFNTELVFL